MPEEVRGRKDRRNRHRPRGGLEPADRLPVLFRPSRADLQGVSPRHDRIPDAVETLGEVPKDPVLSQAFGPGSLANLRPIGTDQAATAPFSRASLRSYRKAVGDVSADEMTLLSEHVNRIVLSSILLAEGDSLLRGGDQARGKLHSWFDPTVESYQTMARKRPRRV